LDYNIFQKKDQLTRKSNPKDESPGLDKSSPYVINQGTIKEYPSNFSTCNFDSILVEFIMMTGGKNEKIVYVIRIDFDVYVMPGI
jgi:hypothetical protein